MRKILNHFGITAESIERPFVTWDDLPDHALLATKWHEEEGKPFWHWACFVRGKEGMAVWDSGRKLKSPVRHDFWRIHPKWYIAIVS